MKAQVAFFQLLCREIYRNCANLLPKGVQPIRYSGQKIYDPWAKGIDLCLWDSRESCIATGLFVNRQGFLREAKSNTPVSTHGMLLPAAPNVFLALQMKLTSCPEFSRPENPRLPQGYEGLVVPDDSPLRPAQREAVRKANAPISFIWGPPGTGKTFSVVQATKAILDADCNNKVLVTATADKAVQAVVDELLGLNLEAELQQFRDDEDIPDVPHRLYDFHTRKASTAKTHESQAEHLALAKAALEGAKVLCANSLSSSAKLISNKFRGVTHLIVDEASMMPMYMVRILSHLLNKLAEKTSRPKPLKIVIVGDPNQLPSVVVSQEMQAHCMGKNIYQYFGLADVALSTPDNVVTFLDLTSRMPDKLTRAVSNTFYGGALQPLRNPGEFNGLFGVQGEQQVGYHNGHTAPWSQLIEFSPTPPCPPKYPKNTSMDEAREVTKLAWLCQKKQRNCLILTPYNNQVHLINAWLKKNKVAAQATTIHKAQGQEADIVIWSVVANIAKQGPSYFNRVVNPVAHPLANVALSRAKQQVFVIGADPNQRTVVGRFLANWENANQEDAGSDLTLQSEVKA